MRTLEDALEQNDNHLDGIINNISVPDHPEEESRKTAVDKSRNDTYRIFES